VVQEFKCHILFHEVSWCCEIYFASFLRIYFIWEREKKCISRKKREKTKEFEWLCAIKTGAACCQTSRVLNCTLHLLFIEHLWCHRKEALGIWKFSLCVYCNVCTWKCVCVWVSGKRFDYEFFSGWILASSIDILRPFTEHKNSFTLSIYLESKWQAEKNATNRCLILYFDNQWRLKRHRKRHW
jgi:hypothetical protein